MFGEILSAFLASEYLSSMLSPDLLAKVTWICSILGIVWARQSKMVKSFVLEVRGEVSNFMTDAKKEMTHQVEKVDKHLKSIEGKFDELNSTIEKGFRAGDARMGKIESDLEPMKDDIKFLKTIPSRVKALEDKP